MYKSALCGLGNAASYINKLYDEGYDLVTTFAVVATDDTKEPPVPVQAIYILFRKRD